MLFTVYYRTVTLQPGDNYIKATGYRYDRAELFKVTGEYLQCNNCANVLDNNWRYTLDESNKTITLHAYKGSDSDIIVPSSYSINGLEYKTKIGEAPIYSSSEYMFKDQTNIRTIKFEDNVDFSDVNSLNYMFSGCTSLEEIDLSNVNTNNVTQMNYMFGGCTSLKKVNLTGFNTENVVSMNSMFWKCTSLTELDLTSFNTTNVTNMWGMFMDCSSLEGLDLGNFNTSNVTDMSHMFRRCYLLNDIYVMQDKWSVDQAN